VEILEILEVFTVAIPVTVESGIPTFVERVEIPSDTKPDPRVMETDKFESPVESPLRTSKKELSMETERFERANPVDVESVEIPVRTSRKLVSVVTERLDMAILKLLCKLRLRRYNTEAEVLERVTSYSKNLLPTLVERVDILVLRPSRISLKLESVWVDKFERPVLSPSRISWILPALPSAAATLVERLERPVLSPARTSTKLDPVERASK
jgi:hypothetical protein